MARTPANITQADLARAIRAARQAGAAEVEVRVGEHWKIVIRLSSSEPALGKSEEIVL
jgi:DNA-binding XRE family transcriptional regulator